ncbi:LXG domain-containing protein [Virgibacillus halodenitrificans]|uniref:LXG domain-containing protein n=1 Tax=Virgibacillus halodenitrificans TaxID=1482 RepID=UPI0024BF4721|nr:LXG domain-containing protein [Virgibacillus halodenitrificans]WHX26185.1 LXG domain-containing protein [Virgibacillus halodenitrificans]
MEQLHNGLDQTVKKVNDLGPQVKELEQRMQALINLEDSFQGKGAQAIKSFYEEAHMPFLLLMEGMLTDFAETIGQIKSSVKAFESNEKGVIHEQFLQENVEQGLTTAENVTLSLTDEANALIDEVKDIVVLPEIQEEDFRQRIKQSRNQVDHTLENLYALDEESTGKLKKIDNELQMMKTYVEKISGLFQNGNLRVADYEVKQLSTYDFHQELVGAVKEKAKNNTFSLDVFLEWGGKKVLSRFGSLGDVAIAYIQEKFSMRTMDYSVRAMKAVLAAAGSHITAAEFTTVKDQVMKEVAVSDYKSEWQGTYLTLANGRILRKYTDTAGEVQYQFVEEIPESREQNAFMKTADAFGEIGQDVWDAAGQRADKMTDSWYDFGNYITFGAVEGMYKGYMHRADKMFDSTYDLFNAFSFGTADMIQGAINPEENFSKEHWLNSIGLAGMVVGARVPAGRAGSAQKATVTKVDGAGKTPGVTPKPKPDAGKMTIPTIQTLTGKLNWFKAHLPELRVVQDSTGGQHYVFSKKTPKENKTITESNLNYRTRIDDKVREIEKADLPVTVASSFKDSFYKTVINEEDIIVYRAFGGNASANGTFTTTSPAMNKIQTKIDLALLPEWKNTREYEAVIRVPKGTVLNIGRAEQQFTKTGSKLLGDEDQILLPLNYPEEWITEIRKIKSR